jgi:PAS domain S-box-containing protein
MNVVMNSLFLKISNTFKRPELLLIIVLLIALTGAIGWISDNMILASYFQGYIPIAPANLVLISILAIGFIIYIKYGSSELFVKGFKSVVVLILLFCLFIFVQFFFDLSSDIENVFLRNPGKLGTVLIGRMSPITSIMYVFLCLGILGILTRRKEIIKTAGMSLSLLSFIVSSVLLIGYLYKAPLLYGAKVIPVSLPSAFCFFLFSLTLLHAYRSHILRLNILNDNKVTRLLLKSFLPVVISISILQGFLDAVFSFNDDNPSLTAAIILFIVIIIISLIVYRVSAIIGTQLLDTERKLKESDTKYRLIADYNFDWEFWQTSDKKFKYNSPSCERISGYKPNDYVENPDLFTQIIHPDDLNSFNSHISPGKDKESCKGLDYRIIIRTGEVRWINHVCQPVFGDQEEDLGRRGSNSDITERKNAEALIKELNKKLKESNADKDRFISILGHDLKSPFNVILGMSELLYANARNLEIAKVQEMVAILNKTAQSTYILLEDILMWAAAHQGKITCSPEYLNFYEVCRNISSLLAPNADAKSISITVSAIDNLQIFADREMLKTILRNLISNAIKFTKPGGAIRITAETDSANIVVSVTDTGIGISPENISKLFDITQVMTTKGTLNERGSGLGLLLCKDFVEKHNGNILVTSEEGVGSNFQFIMPLNLQKVSS